VQQSVQRKDGTIMYVLEPEQEQELWQRHLETKNCPHCDHPKFTMRKLFGQVAVKQGGVHWRYTCTDCKGIWRAVTINTFEQA
jgi:transposase-like protein